MVGHSAKLALPLLPLPDFLGQTSPIRPPSGKMKETQKQFTSLTLPTPMSIRVKCACGHQFGAPEKYAGKRVKCPKCAQPLVIPASSDAGSTTSKVAAKCECGKVVTAKPELAGKTVKCPGCKQPLKLSGGTAKPQAQPKSSSADELFDELGIGESKATQASKAGPGKRCPECRAAMAEDAILCIDCGYNEKLGKKMVVQRPVTEADRVKREARRGR